MTNHATRLYLDHSLGRTRSFCASAIGLFMLMPEWAIAFQEGENQSSESPKSISASETAGVRGGTVAIVGGDVLTEDGETLKGATVLIVDGVIKEISKNVVVPEGTKTIDAAGRWVVPGMIDANSALFRESGNEGSGADQSVVDGMNSFDQEALDDALRRGVTTVYVGPGNGPSPIGGVGAVIKLKPDMSLEEMLVEKSAALHVNFGDGGLDNSLSRLNRQTQLISQVEAANTYRTQWQDYREKLKEYLEKLAKGELESEGAGDASKDAGSGNPPGGAPPEASNDSPPVDDPRIEEMRRRFGGRFPVGRGSGGENRGNPSSSKGKLAPPPKPNFDPGMEVIVKAIEGRLPIRARAKSVTEILAAIDLSKFENVELILEGGRDLGVLIDRIQATKIGVIIDPITPQLTPSAGESQVDSNDLFAQIPRELRRQFNIPVRRGPSYVAVSPGSLDVEELADSDLEFALGSGGDQSSLTRFIAWNAARASAYGLSREQAWSSITGHAADLIGQPKLGRIAPGKDGDIVIVDGDPLDPTSEVRTVLIEGRVVFSTGG